MADGGAKGKIGEAYIEVTADTTKAKRGLEEVRTETETTAASVNQSADTVDKGIRGMVSTGVDGFKKLSGSITSTVGAFTGLVGVVGSVAGAVYVLTRGFQLLRDAISEVDKEIGETGGSFGSRTEELNTKIEAETEKLNELVGRYEDYTDRLNNLSEGSYKGALLGQIEDVSRKMAEQERVVDELRQRRQSIRDSELRTEADLAAAQEAAKAAAEAELEAAKKKAEEEAQLAADRARRAQADLDAIERQNAAWERQRQLRVDAARQANEDDLKRIEEERLFREKRERELKLEEEKARRYAETIERELEDRLFGGSGLLVGNNFTGPLQQINTTLNRLETRIPRTKI